ncbi:MAG: gliding motility protein GldL [Lentimicrobiaceae bacterium]|nr:gliding motility protein GldL [Lentimicrobiaceae bacterium]
MSKLYGWGASLVILGALFKILHLTGADIMLMIGMGTETIIFFFSAFEPLHVEYNWALVYPQLAIGHDEGTKKKVPTGTITQQLDNALQEAKIGPELLESLASGMRNLGDNAKQLTGVSDAVAVTDGFVSSLSKAAESVRNLSTSYEKTADAIAANTSASDAYFSNVEKATAAVGNLANVYEQTVQNISNESGYVDDMKRLSENLSAINAAYELQLQSAATTLNASSELDNQMKHVLENMAQSSDFVTTYKEQVDMLSKNVNRLNDIYGNMLAAMSRQ